MTERLKSICSLIEHSESFIDVGCDHGYAVKYVLDNNLADKITACDISPDSLAKAEKLIGAESGVGFVCADGAVAAKGHETVLISGLGGLEITSVIKTCSPRTFILSPQSHVSDVRRLLLEYDYDIIFDKVVRDGKFYDIIKAKLGGGRKRLAEIGDLQLKYGIYALKFKNRDLADKLSGLLKVFETYPGRENQLKCKEIKEVLHWQLL